MMGRSRTGKEDPEIPTSQREFLLSSPKFILYNNYFLYNGTIYHQEKGTAMGTRMASSYANLFMGLFEKEHITSDHQFLPNFVLYKRYIDDLFILWDGSEGDALKFVDGLNMNTWGINFTPNLNTTEI